VESLHEAPLSEAGKGRLFLWDNEEKGWEKRKK
jgi:hypothetical protein